MLNLTKFSIPTFLYFYIISMNNYFPEMNERNVFIKTQSGRFSIFSVSLFHLQLIQTKIYFFLIIFNFHILKTSMRTDELFLKPQMDSMETSTWMSKSTIFILIFSKFLKIYKHLPHFPLV